MIRRVLFLSVFIFAASVSLAASFSGPYAARVVSVYDGDTFTAEVFVWPGQVNRVKVRIAGIDAPEIRGKCAREKILARRARETLRRILERAKRVELRNVRLGKYAGRVIADVYADGISVADEMIRRGLAVRYDGGKRKSVCDSD